MKLAQLAVLSATAVSLLFASCQKRNSTNNATTDDDITNAKTFITDHVISQAARNPKNYRSNQTRTIQWTSAQKINIANSIAIVVPVEYSKKLYVSSAATGQNLLALSDITKLIITKDSNSQYHYTLSTFIPDSSAISANSWNSGILLSEDWQGNSLERPRRLYSLSATGADNQSATSKQPDYAQTIETCTEIDGYNYSPDDPSGGFSWSETTCTSYTVYSTLLPENQSNPGGGIANIYGIFPIPPAITVNMPPPGNPIGNITDYLKCFTQGDDGHTFSVTLAVEQPIQGTRTPWTFTRGGLSGSSAAGNPFNVGHTWLIFTESTPSGTITRNVGFYPAAIVSPFSRSAQGVLGDDEATEYNISLSVSVNSSQFFSMLNYVSQGNNPGYLYDLNQNNCTSFALDAMAAGNVPIPSTVGHWVGNGQGLDPGDLGEDVRSMALPNGMTRNTVSNPHPNTSSCNL